MRIISVSAALPAVVRVKAPGGCAVAIPENLPPREVLELASLVLSKTEYDEVRRAVEPSEERTTPAGSDSSGANGLPAP